LEIKNKAMRSSFIILFSFISLIAFGQRDSGFTDKKEAKNLMVNGLKEGKWVEWLTGGDMGTPPDTGGYSLTVYKKNVPYGMVRTYFKDGNLSAETYFINGTIKGAQKTYFENGKLSGEWPFTDGKLNGTEKRYYQSGILYIEITYKDDVKEVEREYYPDGKLKFETIYTNGVMGKRKWYDESGNEIKQ
jgi:antitoxin component YwqK of YwqJK toxin-antitoxin module